MGGNFLVTLWLLSTTWPQFKCLNLLLTMSSIVHAVYPSSDGWSRITHQKAQIMSNWLLNHDNQIIVLKWPPQFPALNPVEHLLDGCAASKSATL